MKLDLDTLLKSGPILGAAGIIVAGTLVYARMDATIDVLSKGQSEIVKSVDGVRDDLRKIVTEQVAVRQANQWLELFRALNKDKFPGLVIPDLPR